MESKIGNVKPLLNEISTNTLVEQDCPDTICYQYDYDNNTCVHVKDMKSMKLMKEWYKEKKESKNHRWFFNLIHSDDKLKEYYLGYKENNKSSWTEWKEIIFYARLAVHYCNGSDSKSSEKSQIGINKMIQYAKDNTCVGSCKEEPII